MEKHSVCLLNDSFPPLIDGVANTVVNYANEITDRYGSACAVIPMYPDINDERFPFPVYRYPSIDTSKLLGYRSGYPFSPEIAKKLTEQKVELLHCHCPLASAFMARSLRELLDAPLVLTYHTKFDIDIANIFRSKVLQEAAIRLIAQNIATCDEVWVVSQGAGENLRSIGYEGDYTVMPNGVDMPRGRLPEDEIRRAVRDYDLPADVPLYLFVGRMMWYKGLKLILDALAKMKAQGQSFRMVFIGTGGDYDDVRQYAAFVGLEEVCFFTGAIQDRNEIRAWYCRADLFLFPSTFDTNGLVVREAAACGLAAVLIEGSCAAEGITDGRNGFLIPETAAALAAKLHSLNTEKMHAVGDCACRELYLSWSDAVARAVTEYEIILDRHRRGYYQQRRKTALDSFFKLQGDIMDAVAKLRDFTESVQSGLDNIDLFGGGEL